MMGIPIWAAFGIPTVAALAIRDWRVVLSGCLLLVNWSVLTLNYHVTGDQFAWKLNCAVDWFTAAVLFAAAYDRLAAALALVLIGEILFAHLVYAISAKMLIDQQAYWDKTHYAVWLQAALLGAAGLNGVRRRIRDSGLLARRSLSRSSLLSRGAGR